MNGWPLDDLSSEQYLAYSVGIDAGMEILASLLLTLPRDGLEAFLLMLSQGTAPAVALNAILDAIDE